MTCPSASEQESCRALPQQRNVCGIVGGVSFQAEDLASFLTEALQDLRLRGPDGSGQSRRGQVWLGHSRLAVLDLSSAGSQPMFDPDERVGVTFNGEIYNFRQLKQDLQGAGCLFRSGTDTEVLLHGYEQWGMEGLLGRLDGMFAFALVDFARRQLYLVRDRFGKKPLYYYRDKDCFIFCSDLRPIYRFKRQACTLDEVSLDYYLMELSVPQPRTIFRQVRQVAPAAYLLLDLESGAYQSKSYWRLSPQPALDLTPSQAEQQLRHLLQQAVVKRTVADVPVGCFLSGGIDSGLVVALLSQTSATAVRTFSVGVEGEDNELPDARVLARRYATDHTEFLATPDLFGDLSFLITHMGEPFADSSLLPSFRLCQLMSGQLKVVLSGDGGDELFGGYPEYLRAFRTDQFLQRYPPWARWFAVVADKIWARLLRRRGENLGSCRDYARLAPHQRLYRHMGFSLAERHHLYTPGALQALAGQAEEVLDDLWREHALGGGVAGLMRTSLRSRLLNDYLVKIDRASMLNSLEVRSPFLDEALVEWAFRLPPRLCFGHGEQKWLLKNLAEKEVDSAIRSRPKRGFSIPLADWLRGPLRPQVLQLGEAGGALHHLGLFRGSSLREMVQQHLSGHSDHAHRLWALLILDLWLNQWRLGGTN